MKIIDYILLDHMASRHDYYHAMRRKQEAEETARTLSEAAQTSPAALFFFFLAVGVGIFFFGKPVVRWACIFVVIECTYTILHNLSVHSTKKRYFLLNTSAAAVTFAGLFAAFHFGIWKAGFILIAAGFLSAVFISVISSLSCGRPLPTSASRQGSQSEDRTRSEGLQG